MQRGSPLCSFHEKCQVSLWGRLDPHGPLESQKQNKLARKSWKFISSGIAQPVMQAYIYIYMGCQSRLQAKWCATCCQMGKTWKNMWRMWKKLGASSASSEEMAWGKGTPFRSHSIHSFEFSVQLSLLYLSLFGSSWSYFRAWPFSEVLLWHKELAGACTAWRQDAIVQHMIPSNLKQHAIWSNIGHKLSGELLGLPQLVFENNSMTQAHVWKPWRNRIQNHYKSINTQQYSPTKNAWCLKPLKMLALDPIWTDFNILQPFLEHIWTFWLRGISMAPPSWRKIAEVFVRVNLLHKTQSIAKHRKAC